MTDNQTAAEEKLAMERRKQAMAESRLHRQNAQEQSGPREEDNALDNLLEKLRNGDTIGRKARRARPTKLEGKPSVSLVTNGTADAAHIAQNMLAALQADGFDPASLPSSPTSTAPRRRARRRAQGLVSEAGDSLSEVASPVVGLPDLPTVSDFGLESESTMDLA